MQAPQVRVPGQEVCPRFAQVPCLWRALGPQSLVVWVGLVVGLVGLVSVSVMGQVAVVGLVVGVAVPYLHTLPRHGRRLQCPASPRRT